MILYATQLTFERLHIKPSETLHYALEQIYPQYDYINSVKNFEEWSEIYEWYIELFYFKGKKYLRAVHLSSSFTLFFANVDESFMHGLGYRIRNELLKYFVKDKEMQHSLKCFFSVSFLNFYSRITDKSRINAHNFKKNAFNAKSPFFADFILSDNCIDTAMLNKAVNGNAFICKTEVSGEDRLRMLITEFSKNTHLPNEIINLSQKLELTAHEQRIYAES